MPIRLMVTPKDLGVSRRMRRLIRAGGDLRRPLLRTALFVARRGKERLSAGRKSEVWTGRLAASLTARAEKDRAIVGSNLPYAAAQQLGHPGIRPKPPRKYLAIPMLPRLRRSGLWPRDWPKGALRFVPLKSGKAMLVKVSRDGQKRGRRRGRGPGKPARGPRKKLERVYHLDPGPIRIPAKRYLRMGRQERDRAGLELARHYGLHKR